MTSKPQASITVQRGDYEVAVQNGDTSYYAQAKAGGFLSKALVNAKLHPENARQFVGDDPSPCMLFTDQLYSYVCGASFSSVKVHVPANDIVPTYASSIGQSGIEGTIESITQTSEGNIILAQQSDAEGSALIQLFLADSGLKPTKSIDLPQLSGQQKYSLQPYNNGFLIYDAAFKMIDYYPGFSSRPVAIGLIIPPKGFAPAGLKASSGSIVRLYTNSKDSQSIVYIGDTGNPLSFKFNKLLSDAGLCGQDLLCALDDNDHNPRMIEYSLHDGKAKPMAIVNNVESLLNVGNSTYLVQKAGVLKINPADNVGYRDYSFGSYQYCGTNPAPGGYLLCLVDAQGKKLALMVPVASQANDNIDKKVAKLQSLSQIDSLSIYDRYIFITPALGPLVFDPGVGSYVYNQSTKNNVETQINLQIDKLGISRTTYKIIYTDQ